MSQPNNIYSPTLNYNEDYSESSPFPIGNASFPGWNQHGPRAVGNAAPSPSPSIRSSRTAPNPRTASVSWVQSIPSHSGIDPTLSNASLLAPPQASRSRPALESVSNINPLDRFYNHDAPWSSHNPRIPNGARPYTSQPSMSYEIREGPGSEIESIAHRSDSGYRSYYPRSVMSNDPEHVEDLPSEMTQLVGNLNVHSASSEPMDMFHVASTDQTSQYSGRSTNQGKAEFTCEHCGEKSKCKSDHKKHMLKHTKPFKCDVRNCKRGEKGFTTENDLARHRKSVHRIGMLMNSYQCASLSCRNREKIWPRLDNFKQHIHRMHPDENEGDLIRSSVFQQHLESSPASHPMSVAPMDTTLAGIGTDKQFSGNEYDDPVSGISLTPDQDFHHWTTSDPTSHEFTIDVDQSNQSTFAHDSRKDSVYHVQERLAPYGLSTTKASRNNNLERLDTLATIASSQSPDMARPLPQLSNAPQTKADQQRQALQKLSKFVVHDIKNSSNMDNVDLQDVFMRALSGAANVSSKDNSSQSLQGSPMERSSSSDSAHTAHSILTKDEALKASQAISALIKQSSKPLHTRSRSSPTKGFLARKLTCAHCPMTLARSCDMRKHMKRHTKPYGCTYPKCHKRFGAKSDWKRHENSQHFQLESFRCQIPSSASEAACGELYHRIELFTAHLQSIHSMKPEEKLAFQVKSSRIGKNGQGQFWCGFCETIVKLEKKRNAAWDERFDHIDRHFSKDKRGIDEWLCVEAKKRKGEVAREVDKDRFEEEDEDGEFAYEVHPEPDERGQEEPASQAQTSSTYAASLQEHFAPIRTSVTNSRKRHAEPSHLAISPISPSPLSTPAPPQKRARRNREVLRYCCSCQNGPWAQHTYVDCMSCSHHLCNHCTVVGG